MTSIEGMLSFKRLNGEQRNKQRSIWAQARLLSACPLSISLCPSNYIKLKKIKQLTMINLSKPSESGRLFNNCIIQVIQLY